jgi:hypothetical protein
MVDSFFRDTANGANRFLLGEDVLPEQGALRLDTSLGEEPREEAHLGWSMVLPNEAASSGDDTALGMELVEGSSIESAVLLLARGQESLIGGARERDPVHEVVEGAQLALTGRV